MVVEDTSTLYISHTISLTLTDEIACERKRVGAGTQFKTATVGVKQERS